MAFTDTGSQPGAITFFCLQKRSRHAPSLGRQPRGRGAVSLLVPGRKTSAFPQTSHLPYRLWHILQSWLPGRKHSERWPADDCTSYEPHPADKSTTVAMLHVQRTRDTIDQRGTIHFDSATRSRESGGRPAAGCEPGVFFLCTPAGGAAPEKAGSPLEDGDVLLGPAEAAKPRNDPP